MSDGQGVDREQADVMAGRICAAAGLSAQSECQLIELIGEFDAVNAIRWWVDVKSLAHWLSWCCSMSPGTAREHVRVARALRRMPTITAAFREGRLSYSKVREATRVVGLIDEGKLCRLALTATASQLARMVSGYRTAAGSRITQEPARALTWTGRADEVVDFRIRLPKEEAALVIAALTAAKDQFGTPPPAPTGEVGEQVDTTPAYGYVDAILDVARGFLDTAPEDRSGEDRTLVVVHVAAEQLVGSPQVAGVPAGTSDQAAAHSVGGTSGDGGALDEAADGVAARLSLVPAAEGGSTDSAGDSPGDPTCYIEGLGGVEAETARRLACDADVVGAVVDADGEVLSLGRSRRLVSRAQRRALMIRDGMCQFAGCHQVRHLKAHHRVPWSAGGLTDLDNLILLCQWHHTAVHEGGMRIVRSAEPTAGRRWEFLMPDGTQHRDWYRAESLARMLAQQVGRRQTEVETMIERVDGFNHPDAARIRPGWRGERFDLHECVQALFRMRLPEDESQDAA